MSFNLCSSDESVMLLEKAVVPGVLEDMGQPATSQVADVGYVGRGLRVYLQARCKRERLNPASTGDMVKGLSACWFAGEASLHRVPMEPSACVSISPMKMTLEIEGYALTSTTASHDVCSQ
jgi:hypothetical protein